MKTLTLEQRQRIFHFEEEWIDMHSYWYVVANHLDVSVLTLKKWLRGETSMPFDSYCIMQDFITFHPDYVKEFMFKRDIDDIKTGDIIHLK